MWFGTDKNWWRPKSRRERYPYPAAGILLGICFVTLGIRFALHYTWDNARVLGYVGGGLFVVILVAGVAQPRFLHPRWYGALEDRLGRKGMLRLRSAAFNLDQDEWLEVTASEDEFIAWVDRAMPGHKQTGRGYKSG
jgi:hypothetical protein